MRTEEDISRRSFLKYSGSSLLLALQSSSSCIGQSKAILTSLQQEKPARVSQNGLEEIIGLIGNLEHDYEILQWDDEFPPSIQKSQYKVRKSEEKSRDWYTCYEIKIQSQFSSLHEDEGSKLMDIWPGGRLISINYYVKNSESIRLPLVFQRPIIQRKSPICDFMKDHFLENQMNTAVINRPADPKVISASGKQRNSLIWLLAKHPEYANDLLKQIIIQTLEVINLPYFQEKSDPRSYAVAGYSLGSLLSIVAMAFVQQMEVVEQNEIKLYDIPYFLFSGGSWFDVIKSSVEIENERKNAEKEFGIDFSQLAESWKKLDLNPLSTAKYIFNKDILILFSRNDKSVPESFLFEWMKSANIEQYKANEIAISNLSKLFDTKIFDPIINLMGLSKYERYYKNGHYYIALPLKYGNLNSTITDFFKRKFDR